MSSFLSIADAFIVTMNKNASTFSVPSKIYAYFVIGKPILGSMPFENLGSKKIKRMKVGYISKPNDIKSFIVPRNGPYFSIKEKTPDIYKIGDSIHTKNGKNVKKCVFIFLLYE